MRVISVRKGPWYPVPDMYYIKGVIRNVTFISETSDGKIEVDTRWEVRDQSHMDPELANRQLLFSTEEDAKNYVIEGKMP